MADLSELINSTVKVLEKRFRTAEGIDGLDQPFVRFLIHSMIEYSLLWPIHRTKSTESTYLQCMKGMPDICCAKYARYES